MTVSFLLEHISCVNVVGTVMAR